MDAVTVEKTCKSTYIIRLFATIFPAHVCVVRIFCAIAIFNPSESFE
jgi:peptidoglycan/LPS O-acetylase OafA/YrhL